MRKYVLRTQMLFISALQMLILGAVGLQIRLSGVNRLLGWICNPTVMSISIYNAKICLRSQMLFISALQMLILGAVGLQIRLSGDSFMVESCSVGFVIQP